MKKLSELSDDTMIVISDIERGAMRKDEYFDSAYYYDKEDVEIRIAVEKPEKFSWIDVLDSLYDEQYEDWHDDVYREIKEHPMLIKAEKMVNEIFANHPTYWEGELIENDMLKD